MNRLVRSRRAIVLSVTLLAIACGVSRPSLLPVSLPDVSRLDPAVQRQLRERDDRLLARINDRRTALPDLARAYGEYGMLLQAAEFPDIAEASYRNAQTLAPGELRWPYYLGHLYRDTGKPEQAVESFRHVLTLKPDDLPTLVWLGRLYLDQGRGDEASTMFSRALAIMPQSVAALAGLGRADIARRDYTNAAKHLEAALAIDPQAESLHAPLAAAYRGLGDLAKAQPHLRQWRNTDILLPDPLQQELDLLLESGLSYELRGVRAMESRDFAAAAGFFRRGLELAAPETPLRRSLQHKLGTALFMSGDVAGASNQFAAVIDAAPEDGIDESTAKAHYSLGVLMSEKGRTPDARDHFASAIRYQPSYFEAHLALGDALRREARLQESLHEYEEAVAINPRASASRIGYAIALAGLHRDREARDWLRDSIMQFPDQPQLAHALARLLATSPDPAVRDGDQARRLVEELFKTDRSTGLGETMAMTLAELGDFDQAAAIQRGVIAASRKAGLEEAVRRMEANLRRYEQHQPSRVAWTNQEPVYLPTPITR